MILTESWNLPSAGAVLSPAAVGFLAALWLGYKVLVVLYNISPLHPLYRFPGPKLAAATYAYEGYYDWWLVGRYSKTIKQMHERYGPLVRISPDELHCSDSAFTDEIYAGSGRIRDRTQRYVDAVAPGSAAAASFAALSHELHRTLRSPMNRFFSRSQILKLESEVLDFGQLTVDKMLRSAGGEPFNLGSAYQCFTGDIISNYCFGEPMGFIAQEGWEPNFALWTQSHQKLTHAMRHNSLLRKASEYMPMVAKYVSKDTQNLLHHMDVVIPGYIRAAAADLTNNRLFAELARNKTLPPEKSKAMTEQRLSGEGFALLAAGTETTAATLTVISYHLLANPHILARLQQDLEGMAPETLKWIELEKRPYLWAVVNEGLRLMPGVALRSARIARDEDLVYKSRDGGADWVIPRGTPVSMTPWINHCDENLYPDPESFRPDRWLLGNGEGGVKPNHELQKKLISFGRGSRSCLGEQLAMCEASLMTALFSLRVAPRARLVDTTVENVTFDHELIVAKTKTGPPRVKIAIS
ncbi:hypothetical protein RB599_008759 [Gaeumannomyces hyphopodioides]